MNDKEIGELWRGLDDAPEVLYDTPDEMRLGGIIKDLIRKLVEERTRFYGEHMTLRHFALIDFGIDPSTWKEI